MSNSEWHSATNDLGAAAVLVFDGSFVRDADIPLFEDTQAQAPRNTRRSKKT